MSVTDLIEKFRGVALERVERMGSLLVDLESAPDHATIEELTREIHTLKGEAKMMGFADVNLVSHLTEHLMLDAARVSFDIESSLQDLMFEGLDIVKSLLTKTTGGASAPIDLAGFVDRVAAARGATNVGFTERPSTFRRKAPQVATATTPSTTSMRVDIEKIERLGEVSGEVLLATRRLEYQLDRLDDLRAQYQRVRDAVEPFLPKTRNVVTREFGHELDVLASDLRTASSYGAQWALQLESQSRDLRHIPIEQILQHYPRAVRDLAAAQEKKARFEQNVAGVDVDRAVLNGLADPLLHLVRNAVDHGIEPPEVRVARGKPETGIVRLSADASGDTVRITLSDDGAGIDPQFVAHRAVEKGVFAASDVEAMSDQEKLALIFEAGFSTREEVTDLSGRGIGMDVVRRQIGMIGGTVEIDSVVGEGTTFVLDLPLDSAVTKILVVAAHDNRFALPAKDIERVEIVAFSDLSMHNQVLHVPIGEAEYPLLEWSRVLGPEARPVPRGSFTVLLIGRGGRGVALWIDAVVGEHDAITRPLGQFLAGVRACRGVCITDAGEVVPVLNVNELLSVENVAGVQLQAQRMRATMEIPQLPRAPTILVVEDSEVTRALVTGLLEGAGYRVLTAEDGYDGWERLQGASVDLVLTDVQMPRMSGLSLLERIRADARTKDLPVVILTTLGAIEDKERAMNLGASGYLVKLDFQEKELLQTVRRFLD